MEVIKKYLHKNAHLTKASGILILALFVFGVLVPTGFAHAGFWDWAMDSALDSLGGFVFSIFAAAISLFVSLAILLAGIAGSFLQWILHFGLFYTKCAPTAQLAAGQCFIDVAWGMARDFVNIALIIGLVVIAFFTIIGNQAYSAGKALFPFIAVAILVNFSRVVVGVVVDLSNIVMGVFVQAMPNLSTIDAGLHPVFSFEAETGLILLVTSVLDLLFWMGLAFILALYGIIFAVRYGMIWMLTIMSPIAFAAWIFPSTKKIFNMWRDQLVQWSFIGIPVLFFLWIALKFCEQIRAMNLPEVAAASSGAPGTLYAIFPSIMCLLLLVVAFMFGMKTGAMGSSMIISQGKKWGRAAGMATGKFAGKMALKGGQVGARGAGAGAKWGGRTLIKPVTQKIAPKIPIVKQWQPGYAEKQFDQIRQAATSGGPKAVKKWEQLQKKAGWKGRYTPNTRWDQLTPQQQQQMTIGARSEAAKGAAKILGLSAKGAKRIARTPAMALTPQEKKALAQWGLFGKLRGAQKSEIQKGMDKFKDYSEKDLQNTSKHVRSSTSDKEAAEILLLQKHGGSISPEEKIKIGKRARAVGLGSEVNSSLEDNELEEIYGKDTPEYSRAKSQQIAGSSKAIDDELRSLENLTADATKRLLQTATNIHTKMAAIRKLANDNALSQGEFRSMEASLESFGQMTNVLKRSLQFANPAKISEIMARMSPQDHKQIDPQIFAKGFEKQLQAWFEGLTTEAYQQVMKSSELKQKLADKILRGTGLDLSQNKEVNSYHKDAVSRGREFSTIS